MLGSGLLIPMRNQGKGGPGFTAEALTLFAAMSTPPTAARKILINNVITALITAGAWSLLDGLWVLAAADSQAAYLNWKNPATFTLTETGTPPTFLADRGVTGNGTTSGLVGLNLATFGGQYSLNNSLLGIWCGTDVIENVGDIGVTSTLIRAHGGATTMSSRMNDVTTTNSTLSPATAVGLTILNRTGNASYDVYKAGVVINTVAVAATTVSSASLGICFATSTFSTKREQAVLVGASMSAGQIAATNAALAAYMTAVGA